MGDLYFDAGALSVVDEWLDEGGASEGPQKKAPYKAPPLPQPGTSSGKAGLGFTKPKPGSKQHQDELQARLAKQAEQKRKAASAGGDNEDEGQELDDGLTTQHGVVEDFDTLSKSNIVSKKGSVIIGTGEASAPTKREKKRARAEILAQQKQELEEKFKQEQEQERAQAKRSGYWSQVRAEKSSGGLAADAGTAAQAAQEPEKRKRTKTRSKQKNIRKDSRPLNERPCFRPLTLETERRLTIKEGDER